MFGFFRRWREPRFTWQCYAYGGGAAVTLYNKSRDAATAQVARELGSVAFVDESHRFIFYKPHGYMPTANAPESRG